LTSKHPLDVTAWLKVREPDVLLLQELKGTEFPSEAFQSLGYESVAVTQIAYNGVAILSRLPMKTIAKALVGDDSDSHARFLEVIIRDIRIVNIYVPNGNPVGSDKFAYKLAWMDRLTQQMTRWKEDDVPTLIGGDFNVIPEDIDCHKPSSWAHDALFQPEPRARYRAMLGIGYTDAFRSLHVGKLDISHFGITSGRRSKTIEVYGSTTSYFLQRWQIDWKAAKSTRNLSGKRNHLTTPP
jgi:exodeoxyribonuclease III